MFEEITMYINNEITDIGPVMLLFSEIVLKGESFLGFNYVSTETKEYFHLKVRKTDKTFK